MLTKGAYKPTNEESEILKFWLDNKFYSPEYKSENALSTASLSDRETFSIILPPPNANGNLHLGHMSGYAYQDLMGRYNRMKGKKVLLLPGKDHAGIQTEVVFEKVLKERGLDKKEIGREKFYHKCYDFCMKNSEIARSQEQKIGLSADFDRGLFTLDPKIVDEVLNAFILMYKDGLIYRGKRLINWCPRCKSALADIDTEFKDSKSPFVYFKYAFTEPEEYAVSIKNKYIDKDVEFEVERVKGTKMTIKGGPNKGDTYEWPFDYYGFVPGDKNPADGDDLDVWALGFENLKVGDKISGKAIGIMMRFDKDYKLLVINPEKEIADIQEDLNKLFLWNIKYFAGVHNILFDEYPEDKYYTNGFIMGTVRPETKFGDTAIAVDPKDERYSKFVGNNYEVKTLNGTANINIIEDRAVDMEFGTGAVKVTPAHAPEDWDIAKRHPEECLPEKQVINFDGTMNHLTGKYEGMYANQARKAMLEDMKDAGMLVYVDEGYENRTRICERCKYSIEPLVSHQWFVDTKPLKEKAKELVEQGHTEIMPDGKKKTYMEWMNTPEDWCITRQLWWGYRIPVWYNGPQEQFVDETGQVRERINGNVMKSADDYKDAMYVGLNNPNKDLNPKSQIPNPNEAWTQDSDVLDTWFSSGQWPFLTLKAKEGDFEEFYSTQVMETGWDILLFWVTRMMLLNPYRAEKEGITDPAKQVPFKDVYLHGLVLDKKGLKMSKSKGNGIDPLEMMEKYGTDALRFSFIVGNSAGQNYRLFEEKIASYRNFANKIWNASKFILMNIENTTKNLSEISSDDIKLEKVDTEMIEHVNKIKEDTTRRMDKFQFGVAAQELYESFWHKFADEYIETAKQRLYTKDREGNTINTSPEAKESMLAAQWTLYYTIENYLKMLHPFMPFITERIWQELPKRDGEAKSVMYSKW